MPVWAMPSRSRPASNGGMARPGSALGIWKFLLGKRAQDWLGEAERGKGRERTKEEGDLRRRSGA